MTNHDRALAILIAIRAVPLPTAETRQPRGTAAPELLLEFLRRFGRPRPAA